MLGGDAVDLAQLLGEQVGAVQALVELLDASELELFALGQVLGVLPEREPGFLELFGELLLALAASLIPDLAADLIERVCGGLDDVPRGACISRAAPTPPGSKTWYRDRASATAGGRPLVIARAAPTAVMTRNDGADSSERCNTHAIWRV